jgi:small subunit ribosomal protein S6
VRHYETMYIIDPDVSDDDVDGVVEKYKKIVADGGGTISEAGKWEKGRRQLAYPINKKREGIYILMQFESDTAVPKELDRVFRINKEEILRHLIVRQDKDEE